MSIPPSHWPNFSAPLTRAGRSLCCRWSRLLKLRFAQDGLRRADVIEGATMLEDRGESGYFGCTSRREVCLVRS